MAGAVQAGGADAGQAAALKEQGNALYAAQEWLKAAATYTAAIKLEPENAVLYSNRSAALLQLKKMTKAMEDAERCIQLRSDWWKGYFRKAEVLEGLEKYAEALEAYQAAQQLSPDSKELALKVRTLNKLATKKAQQQQAKQ